MMYVVNWEKTEFEPKSVSCQSTCLFITIVGYNPVISAVLSKYLKLTLFSKYSYGNQLVPTGQHVRNYFKCPGV